MISGVPDTTGQTASSSPEGLRRFSKLTCFSTLFLIFAGGMVTSTGSGLAVPDWPLSYGTLFPPMVGVFSTNMDTAWPPRLSDLWSFV